MNGKPSLAMSKYTHQPDGQAGDNAPRRDSVWGITDLAQDFDITPRTLRFYEDKGLIEPARIGGVRVYAAEDRERLVQIMRAKRLGFSLDDIKEVFDVMQGEVTDRVELLRRKGNFERVIKSLQRRQDDLVIVRRNLTALCARIEDYIDDPQRDANVLQLAGAYDAAVRAHMDDDFFDEDASRLSGEPKTPSPFN